MVTEPLHQQYRDAELASSTEYPSVLKAALVAVHEGGR